MICIGIDPGISGAVAVLHSDNRLIIHDMPIFEMKVKATGKRQTKTGFRIKREVSPNELTVILAAYQGQGVHILLEDVHAFPKQGVVSVFSFGLSKGIAMGVVAALGFPLTLVKPDIWKKYVLHGEGKEKDVSVKKACQLFPHMTAVLKGGKDGGRAEAALMAWFLQQQIAFGDITQKETPPEEEECGLELVEGTY